MSLMWMIGDARQIGPAIWTAHVAPAEVRRLGGANAASAARSVVALNGAEFDGSSQRLYVDPSSASVLTLGTSDEVVFIDVGANGIARDAERDGPHDKGLVDELAKAARYQRSRPRFGDQEFIRECERLLGEKFGAMARSLLGQLRRHHPGHLCEGLARKWVNDPENFVAITIQPRDRSLAIHVKGNPGDFDAPSLDIKADRPSYSRFKLGHPDQLNDAIQVVLLSARRTTRSGRTV
jgi:hypothetical protein